MKKNFLLASLACVLSVACVDLPVQAAPFSGFNVQLSSGGSLYSASVNSSYDDHASEDRHFRVLGGVTDMGGQKVNVDVTAEFGYAASLGRYRMGGELYYTQFFMPQIDMSMAATSKPTTPHIPSQSFTSDLKASLLNAKGVDFVFGRVFAKEAFVYIKLGPTWLAEQAELVYDHLSTGGSSQPATVQDPFSLGFHGALGASFNVTGNQYINVEADLYRSGGFTTTNTIRSGTLVSGKTTLTTTTTTFNVGYGFTF